MANRVRKYDWEQIQKDRKDGMSYRAISEKHGCHTQTAMLICNPKLRKQFAIRSAAYQRTGRCPDCGTQTTKLTGGVSTRCVKCNAKVHTTTARDGELRCSTCQRWLPDWEFPKDKRRIGRRYRHRTCRECNTRMRRDYRNRQKVPCILCGQPRLNPRETSRYDRVTIDTGLCLSCYRALGAHTVNRGEGRLLGRGVAQKSRG